MKCPDCEGGGIRGDLESINPEDCETCKGTGEVPDHIAQVDKKVVEPKCPYCGGPNHKKCPGPEKAQEDHVAHERDFRKFRRFGLNGYEEIVEQPNGEFVYDEDYLEACDEIDTLRARVKELDVYNTGLVKDNFRIQKERYAFRLRVKELEQKEKNLLELNEDKIKKKRRERNEPDKIQPGMG